MAVAGGSHTKGDAMPNYMIFRASKSDLGEGGVLRKPKRELDARLDKITRQIDQITELGKDDGA